MKKLAILLILATTSLTATAVQTQQPAAPVQTQQPAAPVQTQQPTVTGSSITGFFIVHLPGWYSQYYFMGRQNYITTASDIVSNVAPFTLSATEQKQLPAIASALHQAFQAANSASCQGMWGTCVVYPNFYYPQTVESTPTISNTPTSKSASPPTQQQPQMREEAPSTDAIDSMNSDNP